LLRDDESGASAVEFALLLPLLVMLLFGTMYGASLFNSLQTVNQAAREGARFGATLPRENPADWEAAIENRIQGILDVDRPLTPGAVTIDVAFVEVSDVDRRVEVTVTRQARLELGVASLGPLTLTGSGVGRYEGA
jgi:Flp pilus assembly protein TadG